MRGRNVLAISFVALASLCTVAFNASVRLDPAAAWSRFEALSAAGHDGRAVGHGDRALLAWSRGGEPFDLFSRRLTLANAHYRSGDPAEAAAGYVSTLAANAASDLSDAERVELNRRIAELELGLSRVQRPAAIAASFIERAGDAAAGGHGEPKANLQREAFVELVDQMRPMFTDVLGPDGSGSEIAGSEGEQLAAAEALTTVGGYYASQSEGAYAAAGLLALAHKVRERQLGPTHADTVQAALLLAPVYERIDRLSDAEDLYENIFHAQERARGPNNPELSLYIRLLSGIYEKQGRLTEAEALNRHMRQMFRDAFGARRYAANQTRDRQFAVNRPVSFNFRLDAGYKPEDLVSAEAFDIPLSKPSEAEEMQLRRAAFDDTSMPEQLTALLSECQQPDERLSLRSGYRSHGTQEVLHAINEDRGTVAEPGTSEHQLGLAVDIDVNRRFMRATDRAYTCFETKAWQYGFILSFPPGNPYLDAEDSYEPWHWRYVGPRTALLYREIGPWGRPQEFLAALPCYEERALSGLFVDRERGDICIEQLNRSAGDVARGAG